MKRTALKTVENKVTEFIPPSYKDFKEDSEDIYERPLIAGGKRLTRDQMFEFRSITKVKYPKGTDTSKLSNEELADMAVTERTGKAYKYVWDNCVHYLKNVILNIEGKEETYDKVEDKEKLQLIWDQAQGFEVDIMLIVKHFVDKSQFTEEEEKNSDSPQDSTEA